MTTTTSHPRRMEHTTLEPLRAPPTPRGIAGWSRRQLVLVLILGALFTLAMGVLSAGTIPALKTGGFDDPKSESVLATAALNERFDGPQPNLVILVDRAGATADSADVAAAPEWVSGCAPHQT